MPNSRKPCWCCKCKGNEDHFLPTRNSHQLTFGIFHRPPFVQPVEDPPHYDNHTNSEPPLQIMADSHPEPIATPLAVSHPPPEPDVGALDPVAKLSGLYLENKGRPLGDQLMTKILHTISEIQPGSKIPRTAKSLAKKATKETKHSPSITYVRVCGVCYLHKFTSPTLTNSVVCPTCGLRIFTCKNPACGVRQVDGKGCIVKSSRNCCGVSSDSPRTIQSYTVLSFADLVKNLLATETNARELLQPFESVISEQNIRDVKWNSDLYSRWLGKVGARPAYKEAFDGSRFQQHPLIAEGFRNILFHLSVDGLPIFKSGSYSLWVLTATPANFSCTRRAHHGVYVMGLIDGPSEPKHTYFLLDGLLKELAGLADDGMTCWDALTQSEILVKASVVNTSNDLPASSKLCKSS